MYPRCGLSVEQILPEVKELEEYHEGGSWYQGKASNLGKGGYDPGTILIYSIWSASLITGRGILVATEMVEE